MLTNVSVTYLDSSALVKLVVPERESDDLQVFLTSRPNQATSALARVEVVRAVLPYEPGAVLEANELLRSLTLVDVSDSVLDLAAELQPHTLRSLDAIHLATAKLLGNGLGDLVTYDRRMMEAAQLLALRVASPGWI